MQSFNKKLLMFLIIGVFSFFILYSINVNLYGFNTPDESIQKNSLDNIINTGKFFYQEPLIKEGFSIIIPRGFYNDGDKIVSLKFVGFQLFVGLTCIIVPKLYNFIIPIFAIICAIFLFKLSFYLYHNKKISSLSFLLLLFLPFFWYWSNHSFMENVLASSFFVIGFYYILQSLDRKNIDTKLMILAILFFGVSLSIRHDLIIALICMLLPFLINVKKLRLNQILIFFIIIIIVIIPVFYLNKLLYGGIFMYGQKILSDNYTEQTFRNIQNVLINFKQIFSFFPILSLFLLGILIIFLKKDKIIKKIAIGLILYTIVFSLIFFSEFPPKQAYPLHESYVRYFLIFYVFTSLFISILINELVKGKFMVIFIFTFIVLSVLATVPSLEFQWNMNKKNLETKNAIVYLTPNNSIILVNGEDKFIFPDRKVGSLSLIKNDSGGLDYENISIFIFKLKQKNFPLYIRTRYLDFNQLNFTITKYNLNLSLVDVNEDIYKIT